ncbi:putative acyl-CoA dehydrogenase [Rhodoligotrophos appendicifer]|uniref:acyl-CoA dehydrogenase family protein n=1 Tax=Rhodoligotrophos appendicifer TaxID=987056 RepID=UPI00117F3F24|nr:acyl-CoA dehydrogenase family protein [Rhodoligotrophos appendicifer]
MSAYAPRTHLETHEVSNVPTDFAGRNLFAVDRPFREAALREGGEWLREPLMALGEAAGSEHVLALGEAANRYQPELVSFDRYGRRLDEVRFHPAYHELMELAMDHRIHDIAWTSGRPGGHVAHLSLLALFTQAEAGTMCPVNMTYASLPALRIQPEITQPWIDRILGGRYDSPLGPIATKSGITLGMAMTEKQGGSDVRANTTRAYPLESAARSFRLVGHKWFCSAPMSDGFLTLAYTDAGLSCFLVPRIRPDGERNAIHVMRLKDKLGNRSNASAEIEYHDAYAQLLGEEGQGVRVIIDMVHHTRLGTIGSTLGLMRAALAQAVHHVSGRRAFQKTLIDQPAMRNVIADLALDYEAAICLAMRIAAAFDAPDPDGRAFARLVVALGKYWLTKRTPNFIYECMECHGGIGYVEETPMPRLFRESPVNAIWEGSGNVIALDILRTLAREPSALEAFRAELSATQGANPHLDRYADDVLSRLSKGALTEADARIMAERMALLLQASLLVRHTPAAVSDTFCATRLGANGGLCYGTLPATADITGILARQLPG